MNAINENPALQGGESENNHGPGSRYFDYIAPPLSKAATRWLNEWCDAIADGSISLAQLPLPVVSLYLLGYAHAEHRFACNHRDRISRLEYERDLWYWIAQNPGKTANDYMTAATRNLVDLGLPELLDGYFRPIPYVADDQNEGVAA